MRRWWGCLLYTKPTRLVGFCIASVHWNNGIHVDMLLHLAHYPDKESISLQFLHAVCLAETQQIQVLHIHPGFFGCEIRNENVIMMADLILYDQCILNGVGSTISLGISFFLEHCKSNILIKKIFAKFRIKISVWQKLELTFCIEAKFHTLTCVCLILRHAYIV